MSKIYTLKLYEYADVELRMGSVLIEIDAVVICAKFFSHWMNTIIPDYLY